MSNQRIVFTNPDGSVGVIIPAPNCPLSLAEIMQKDVPADATGVRQCTTDDLPANRNYRGAWDDSNEGNTVGINAGKAGDIAHGRRRTKREEQLAPLDKEQNFASVTASRKTAIKEAKLAILGDNADVQTSIEDAVAANDVAAIEAAEVAAGTL